MITQTELIKMIRERTGCGMLEARDALEKLCHNMGVMTRRDKIAATIYGGISAIPDSLEARKVSAGWAVECADELIKNLDKDKDKPHDG